MWTGYNNPIVDVSVAVSSDALNLRDSYLEDNVRKRPLPTKIDPQAHVDYPSHLQIYKEVKKKANFYDVIFLFLRTHWTTRTHISIFFTTP